MKPSATMWRDDGFLVNTAATLCNTMESRHFATRVGFLVRSSTGPLFPLTHFAQHNSLHWCHAHHAHKVTHCCRGASPQNKSKWAHDPKLEPVQHARIELGNSFLSIAKSLWIISCGHLVSQTTLKTCQNNHAHTPSSIGKSHSFGSES